MTMTGGTWTPTTVTPTPGAGPLTIPSAVSDIMQWLADNNTGDISALDLRNSFDLVFSLLASSGARVTASTVAGQIPAVRGGGIPAPGVNVYAWPANYAPNTGELFINEVDGTTWVYDGTDWVPLGGAGGIHYVAAEADLNSVRATASDMAVVMSTGNLYRIGVTYTPAPTNQGGAGVWSTKHLIGAPPAATGVLSVMGGTTLIIGDDSQGGIDTVDQTKMAVGDEFWLVDTQDPTRWDHYAIDSLMGTNPFTTQGTHGYTIRLLASGTNGHVPTGADVRLFYNYVEPTPQQGWELVGHIGYRVTVKDIAGVTPTPTDPPKAFNGDVFINVTDKKFWIYGPTSAANPAPIWHQLSGGIKVTALTNSGQTPTIRLQTPQGVVTPAFPLNPNIGDLVVNTTDKLTWLFDGVDWRLVAAAEPNIAITNTAGDNPGNQPPAFTPRIGDLYINDSDGSAWVWAHAPGGGDIWQPLTPATGNVYVSDVAGDIPFAPAPGAAGQQQFQFPPRRPLNEGDRFVNRTDHISWVYGPDPGRPGQLTWIEIPTSTNAIATNTPGEVPFAPPPGATMLSQYQFTRPSRVGDIFINTVDGKTWAYVDDPAGGGQIWQQLPPTTVLVGAARGDDPWTDARASDPATGAALATLSVGSMYVNPFTNEMYVVTDDGAGGLEWVQVSEHVRGTKVTVFDTAGDLPVLINNPRIGDVCVNTADRLAWIYGELNGVPDWQPIAAPNTVVVALAAGDDPWTDARTSDPATGDIVDGLVVGDMYVNPFTMEAYIVVDDGSGPTWVQMSGQPPHAPLVTVGTHHNDIPNGGATTVIGTYVFRNWTPGVAADGDIAYNTEIHIRDVDATGAAPSAVALAATTGGIRMVNTANPQNVVNVTLLGAFTHDAAAHVWKAPVLAGPTSGLTSPVAGAQYTVTYLAPGHSVAGTRDDVYYNEYDRRMWIHDGTDWVEILLANGTLLVPNEAARLALVTPPAHIPDDTLVVQQDTGWTWRYDATLAGDPFYSQWRVFSDYISVDTRAEMDALTPHTHVGTLCGVRNNHATGAAGDFTIYQLLPDPRPGATTPVWMAMLPQVQVGFDNLQTLTYDPGRGFGERVVWEDDRTRLEIVNNIADLSDRTLLPQNHLAVGKLVFVRAINRIYQYTVDTDAQPTPEVPTNTIADWADINTARNAPGLEGVIVPAAAPNDPGTVKWAAIDAARLGITPPGGYFVIADATATVPAGVPSVAGQAVKAGDWLVAIDTDADGTSDAFHIISMPATARPLVTVLTTAGASITGTPTKAATWAITSPTGTPPIGAIHVTGAGTGITEVQVSSSAKTPAGAFNLAPLVPAGTVVKIVSTADPNSWLEFIVGTAAVQPGGDVYIKPVAGSVRVGPGPALPGAAAIDVDLFTSTVIAGQRDDVVYNSVDHRTWIHDGTKWVELLSASGQVYVSDIGAPVAVPVVLDGAHVSPVVGWAGSTSPGFGHEAIWKWLAGVQGSEPTAAYFVDETGQRIYELTDDAAQAAGANLPTVLTAGRKIGEWVVEGHTGAPATSGGRVHADAADATMTTIGISTTAVTRVSATFTVGADLFPVGSTVRLVNKNDATSFVEFVVGSATLNAGQVVLTKQAGSTVRLGAGPAVVPAPGAGNISVDVLVVPPTPVRKVSVRTFEIAPGWPAATSIYNIMFNADQVPGVAAAARLVLNQDGSLSVKDGTNTMKVRVQGTTGPFLPTFSAPAGVHTKASSVKYVEGDEYVATLDQRNWVYDGTKWVERTHKADDPTLQLYVTVPATNPPDNAMDFSTYQHRAWSAFKIGVPAIIREVDANGLLPTMSSLPNLSGQFAQPGDWLMPIDKNGDGVSDAVMLVRQSERGPMVHESQPGETGGQIFLDRGLAAFGLTIANDAVAQDARLDGIWEAYITGVCRSTTDLYLIMHDPDFPGPTPPTDAPFVDRSGKKALGPWHVKAQSQWTIKVIGNSRGYGGWEVTFSGQNANGARTFDMATYNRGASGRSLPVFGVEAAAGNIYLNRVMFRLNRESA